MTEQEFLIVANNFRNQVNVWYTATAPYTILGLTVPIINIAGENIIGYLQQATVITVQVNEDTGEYVTLNITQRSLLGDTQGQYYFFNTSAGTIQDPGDDLIRPGQIIFTPGIDGLGFQEGGYNVTAGLTNEGRRSEYIMQADRISYISTGAGLPTNIDQLQTNNATRAQVQDSLYSDTGWISARYEGSKISTLTNLNVDPALQGTFFEAASFSLDTNDEYIQQLQTVGALTYGQYFFSGEGSVPRYLLRLVNWKLKNTYFSYDSALTLQRTTTGLPITQLSTGDRFYIYYSSAFKQEVIQMTSRTVTINTAMSPLEGAIVVRRGYNNTPRQTLVTTSELYRISPMKLYTLQGSIVQGVKQGKVIVKGMDEVLYIDVNGFVIGGSNPDPVVT
tara:strand:- start:538 stop:1713 length:1176 start_codon:yes stop_codon:yes gene_type:complete